MKEFPMKLTAVFEQVPEGYIGFVEELPGANSQGATLEDARENLAEAVELVLELDRRLAEFEANPEEGSPPEEVFARIRSAS